MEPLPYVCSFLHLSCWLLLSDSCWRFNLCKSACFFKQACVCLWDSSLRFLAFLQASVCSLYCWCSCLSCKQVAALSSNFPEGFLVVFSELFILGVKWALESLSTVQVAAFASTFLESVVVVLSERCILVSAKGALESPSTSCILRPHTPAYVPVNRLQNKKCGFNSLCVVASMCRASAAWLLY